MPRISAESRSAAVWRGEAKHAAPPKHLSRDARKLWREIVESRMPDYFQPGSFELLAQFCEVSVAQRAATKALAADPLNPDLIKAMKDFAAVLNSTAVKLRLAISSSVRAEDGRLDEKQPRIGKLVGGTAVWLGDNDERHPRAN